MKNYIDLPRWRFDLPKGDDVWMFMVACGETARIRPGENSGARPGLKDDLQKSILI